MRLGKTPSKLPQQYLTSDTDAVAGEVSSGRLIQDDTDDTPEQTVYENDLPGILVYM